MVDRSDTVIVGAGPYGLSIAAHLRARGLSHRIIGTPLQTWRTAMPEGMSLKSDGFASSLSAPVAGATLADYCREHGLPYHPTDRPVLLETFVAYGLDFQRRFVPGVEPGEVLSVARASSGRFRVTLSGGEEIDARQVVVAAGIAHFANLPAAVAEIDSKRLTHASEHREFAAFEGQDVTVLGAGSSAVEVSVALARAGARPRLVCRADEVHFGEPPAGVGRSLAARMRRPSSGLGPGYRSRACCEVPDAFRLLPVSARSEIVRRHLGPSSPWHLRPAFESGVEVVRAHRLARVDASVDALRLSLEGPEGDRSIETGHLICATGYRADLARLRFLEADMRRSLRTFGSSPALNAGFESSVPGLYFAGVAAAMSFGPLMRFMYGDEFAARRISRAIAKRAS